jgi:hypothetical protein
VDRRGWVGVVRREGRAFVELFALCGFAITQPLLDLFGQSVDQFALRGASGRHIVGFGLIVTLAPAAGLWLVEAVTSVLGQRVRRVVHVAVLGLLVAATAVQAARPLATGAVLFVAAGLIGLGAAAVYLRAPAVRLWLSFAGVAPVGFLALFLFASPTADLLRDDTTAASVAVGSPAPVVMVVLDELPLESLLDTDGEIDATLFPNLARLAGDSHWFRNATTVATATWHAVPAILTGQLPEPGTNPIAADHPENVFTLLGASYELDVTETITRLCPASLCDPDAEPDPASDVARPDVWEGLFDDATSALRARLSLHRPAHDPVADLGALEDPEEEVGDADGHLSNGAFGDLSVPQPARFRSLLAGLDDHPQSLHFLHLLLPHVPWRYLPSGAAYAAVTPDVGRSAAIPDTWDEQEWPTILGRQRHLLQLAYVDDLIGSLVRRLERLGVYDESLIVLTADHGISFEPGDAIRSIEGQRLTRAATSDLLWVPLFVKEPGQRAGDVSDANVLTIDVVPTIADVLDVEIPWAVDGRSALGPPRTTTDKPFYGNDVERSGVEVRPPVTIDGPPAFARMLRRTAGSFLPPPGTPDRLWRVGPDSELVGMAVDDVPAGRLEPVDAVFEQAELFDDVRPGRVLPLLIRGNVPGADLDVPLAVAVNGTVVATGVTYGNLAGAAFAMVMDSDDVVRGRNDVRVYLLG